MITKIKRVLARIGIGNPLNVLMYDKNELPVSTERPKYIERRGRPRGKYNMQQGRFGIKTGNFTLRVRFHSLEEAQKWGEWNYKGAHNWKVIEL